MNRLRFLVLILVLTTLFGTRAAFAGEPASRKAMAEALFVQGREAMQRGAFGLAAEKLEDSQAIDAAVGTLLNLATCYEELNRTASAWVTYKRAAALARAQQQTDREAFAREKAASLKSSLAYIVVEPSDPPKDLKILRDDEEIPRRLWGKPVPVDPGDYRVVARAPGRPLVERGVTAAPGKIQRVVLTGLVDKRRVEAPPPAAPARSKAVTQPTAGPSSQRRTPARDVTRGDAQRLWGAVVGGAGIAGLVVGGAFMARAISKNDDSQQHCQGNLCDDTGKVLRDWESWAAPCCS